MRRVGLLHAITAETLQSRFFLTWSSIVARLGNKWHQSRRFLMCCARPGISTSR